MKKALHISLVIIILSPIAIAIWFNSDTHKLAKSQKNVEKIAVRYEQSVQQVKVREKELAEAKLSYNETILEVATRRYGSDKFSRPEYENSKKEVKRLKEKLGLEYEMVYRIPLDLWYVFLGEQGSRISHEIDDHYKVNGLLALDLSTHRQSWQMYVPDLYNKEIEWYVEAKNYPESTGYTLVLTNEKIGAQWIIGHAIYDPKDFPKTIKTGEKLAMSSGRSGFIDPKNNAVHTHIEFFSLTEGKWQQTVYKIGESNKHIVWHYEPDKELYGSEKEVEFYFSGYNVGDKRQNDETPCIGASTKDLCKMLDEGKPVVAITPDQRNLLGVEYGDKVKLTSDGWCDGLVASVEDNMNSRFAEGEITSENSQGWKIKGDIAFKLGVPVKGCVAKVSKFIS